MAGPPGGYVVDHGVFPRRRLRTVRHDGGGVVGEAQLHAQEVPVAARLRNGLLRRRSIVRAVRRGSADARHHARVVERPVGVEPGHGTSLAVVGLEQLAASNARTDHGQLPRQVVYILNARVHAEPSRRWQLVSDIAGENDSPGHKPSRYRGVHRPSCYRENVWSARRIPHGRPNPVDAVFGSIGLEGGGRAIVVNLAQPAAAGVKGLEDSAGVLARDKIEDRRAVRHQRIEVRLEVDVDEMADAFWSIELDAHLTSYGTGCTVGGDQVL